MKKTSALQSAFITPRTLLSVFLCLAGLLLAAFAFGLFSGPQLTAQPPSSQANSVTEGKSYHNDVSPPLREMRPWSENDVKSEHEASENPKVPHRHKDSFDPIIQNMPSSSSALATSAPTIAAAIYNFDGIPFPGVGCNCAPPDTNGAVGKTQYVQIVNEGYQVFDKTGVSKLGPNSISSIWAGFGGGCETLGSGDPVVLYDQLADRWVITQFAKATSSGPITDECVAVSATPDATGAYYRYGFHLGSNFYDYPHLAVWPDGYYMSMNVFNAAGTSYLGPQAFAFDRAKMLAGTQSASFVSPGTGPLGGTVDPFLPANLDGFTLPPAGAPNTFVGFPGQASNPNYTTYHFHADFAVPSNSTFTVFANPPATGFTSLCPTTRACVPQAGVTSANNLDASGDRLMFRLAYRNFGDHESVVGNYSVNANGVAGVRWFELRNVTASPIVYQEGTYAPAGGDWRWMGSVAMDGQGNMALGFSASSSTINPQLRYAARLVTDPLNSLGQETHLFDGTGSQSGTGNRWGDYASLTVDPVDDSTFWFTSEYYSTTSTYNWRTRISSFKVATGPTPSPTPTPVPSATPIPTATPVPTPTPTPVPDFALSVNPSSFSLARNGGTATYTVTITPSNGFTGSVTFSVTGQPPGTTATFSPNPATTSSTLTLTVPSTVRGTYPLTITGTSGALTHNVSATLVKSK
jgi:hypothetical protein